MTKEEIVTALLDDMEMPYLQDWQARDIVDFVLKKHTEGLPALKGWVARENPNTHPPRASLSFFTKRPKMMIDIFKQGYWGADGGNKFIVPEDIFPDLKWQDEPIEVELTISRVIK